MSNGSKGHHGVVDRTTGDAEIRERVGDPTGVGLGTSSGLSNLAASSRAASAGATRTSPGSRVSTA